MRPLPCGHVAWAGSRRACRHLIEPGAETEYVRLFSGHGADYDLCCVRCADATPDLMVVCEGCLSNAVEENFYDSYRGTPTVVERPERVDIALRRAVLPVPPLDVAPVAGAPYRWLLLTADGVVDWHSDGRPVGGALVPVTVPAVPAEGYFRHLPPRPRLYASASGRYCAIVVDFARHGVVIDLVERRVVADLDRGAYYPGTQHFPFAFLDLPDGEAYVHGTDWNRLDVSRARTGQLLTGREFPPGADGRPERATDYFHGGLSVSPDGRWIADDGWVWSPVGVPTVWSVDAWLADPYESEDGLTLRRLAQRPDWNEPIVWSGGRLVLRGLGAWGDEGLLPGAEVFDPATGDEVLHFAGLEGRLLSFGDRLFSASVDGLDIWDATTGRRTGRIAGFQPVAVHPASGELLALEGVTVVIGQPAAQRS